MREAKAGLDQVKDGLGKVEEMVRKVEETVSKATENCSNIVFEEFREREARKLNLVLHGVQEHEDSKAPGKDKQVWDRSMCVKICEALDLDYNDEVFKFCRRVAVAEEGPRAMVIGFYTEMERSMLLRKAKKLQETDYSHIRIAPDMTKRQRKEERDLWGEAEERNQARSEEQVQKNLAWMVVGARGEKRLILQPSRPGPPRTRMRGRGAVNGCQGPAAHPGQPPTRGRTVGRPPRVGRGARVTTRVTHHPASQGEIEVDSGDGGGEEEEEDETGATAPTSTLKRKAAMAGLEGQPAGKK